VSELDDYIIWLAEYRDVPLYQGYYHMWQYTSGGSVDGIEGNVDFNLSYLKVSDIQPMNQEGTYLLPEEEAQGIEAGSKADNGEEEDEAAAKSGKKDIKEDEEEEQEGQENAQEENPDASEEEDATQGEKDRTIQADIGAQRQEEEETGEDGNL